MQEKIQQVIVIRRLYPDNKGGTKRLTNGKYCSQAAHASTSFLTNKFRYIYYNDNQYITESIQQLSLTEEESYWVENSFTKICLCVNTEEELINIYDKAKEEGLTVYMIIDSGLTEFNSVPTHTCLAIGPHYKSKIDKITKDLPLF